MKAREEQFFKSISNTSMISQLFETMPYPVAVFNPDGSAAYMNPALCENLNINSFDELLGIEGLREFARKIFRGEMARAIDIRMPFNKLLDEWVHLNITGYPIFGEGKKIIYIFCMAHRTATYQGKREVIAAKQYIDDHWLMEFNAERVAESAGLSTRHLDRLFKTSTGETPFNYYKRIKIEKIKEALADPNLNIEKAFEICCVDYNGTYAQYFKEAVGMSPLEYKKKFTRK